ncbi:MAG: glycoside hydrolase family 88 protein [candidate division WOR-3 bacterium]
MKLNKLRILFVVLLLFFFCKKIDFAKDEFLEGEALIVIGKKLILDLLKRPNLMIYEAEFWRGIHYAEACAGFGAARLAGLFRDKEIIEKITIRYRRVVEDGLIRNPNHVDANVYGILPLELYIQTKDESFLKEGLELANKQWEDTLPGGITKQIRYWIDDVWMIGALQIQAYRATRKEIYLERAAKVISLYLKRLQKENGLFYHGEEAPIFWGRGNGWVAVGLAELLTELPSTNPYYPSILEGYRKMMNALIKYQTKSGMWRQILDKEKSWEESSCTAMFGYAITVGVKKGLLPREKFTPAYKKAWKALVKYIDEEGKLTNVCGGTGKSKEISYYLNRPKLKGDLHGQAACLWFVYSLLFEY